MTPAGHTGSPDLSAPFEPASDILAAIPARAGAKAHFASFPDLYVRLRIGNIEEMRKRPEEFARRMDSYFRKTEAGQMFGKWNDGGRLS
jgi:hypothetical protein